MNYKTNTNFNAFLVAGIGSGSGKTTITLGLISAFKNMGKVVAPFKCGPDYIDTGFQTEVAKKKSVNLDVWLMGKKNLKASFYNASKNADIAIIEGVMGLYDGLDVQSNYGSSADIAKILDVGVVLVVNAKGMARSFGALVKGYCDFDKDINIIGIIANGIGSDYHASLLQTVLEQQQLPPLIGYLNRDKNFTLPERHLGLVPEIENDNQIKYDLIAKKIETNINLKQLLQLSKKHLPHYNNTTISNIVDNKTIAIAYDKAFSFYYQDNINLFKEHGFNVIKFSPLMDKHIPKSDMLYFGGGFPEIFAKELSQNNSMLKSIKDFSSSGGIIYAECGGLMYLSQTITTLNNNSFNMCGIFPIESKMNNRLKRLGYRQVTLMENCFLGKKGDIIRGHEFHYSESSALNKIKNIYSVTHPTKGIVDACGYKINNTIASYIHIHCLSNPNIIDSIKHFNNW